MIFHGLQYFRGKVVKKRKTGKKNLRFFKKRNIFPEILDFHHIDLGKTEDIHIFGATNR